jgi:hypothetical protein
VSLVSILQAGRRDFLYAVAGQADIRPRSGWSVLECLEHVVAVEERHFAWLTSAEEIVSARDADKELRLFSIMRSRLNKVETPEAFVPRGRFATVEPAVAAFETARARMVEVVRAKGDAIYAVGVTHPYFGDVNGAELVQLADGHARRHAEQIREIVGGAP